MRPKLLLPLIQVPFAGILLLIGHYEIQSPRGHLLYASFGAPATRLAFALNAPAFLFRWCLSELVDRFHPLAGASEAIFNHLIFLISVCALWYAIGWQMDRKRDAETMGASRSALSVGICIGIIFLGLFLGVMAIGAWTARSWRYVPLWQTVPEGTLYLFWALALIGVCGRGLLSQFRPTLPTSGPGT